MAESFIQAEESKKAHEITELNRRLAERSFRYENLVRDVQRTRENIGRHDDDMLKITRTLQKQIDEKTETIASYQKKLAQLEQNAGKDNKSLNEKYEFQKNELNRKQENELDEQSRQMKQLKTTQESILEFENSRLVKEKELENEENRYKMLLKQLAEVKEQGKEDLERQKQRINAQYAQFLEDFKKNAQTKAEKNISEIERNIQAQNQRLEDEAKLQEDELVYLELKNSAVEKENEQCQMELHKKGLTVEEHAKKQFEKNKKIKLLKTKIELLEKSLTQIVSDFEKEKELLKFQNEQIIREQHEELKNLQESTRLKNNELSNLKAVCQMILDQRSDIEQFFLESMEQVKEEKRRKMETEAQQQASHKQPEFLPLIEPGSKFSKKKNFESQQTSTQSQGKKVNVELNDLDWEDRETVLRLLFSKMNTGEPASSWREALPPSRTGSRSTAQKTNTNPELNRSFREEEEEEQYTGQDENEEQYFEEDDEEGDGGEIDA